MTEYMNSHYVRTKEQARAEWPEFAELFRKLPPGCIENFYVTDDDGNVVFGERPAWEKDAVWIDAGLLTLCKQLKMKAPRMVKK